MTDEALAESTASVTGDWRGTQRVDFVKSILMVKIILN